METVKTQITLPKAIDKTLKMIKVEFDLENKSEAVEFLVGMFRGEFNPEIDKKFALAMEEKHREKSKKIAKSLKDMNKEMESW